ncbi:hypothetical protein BH10BAC6_BH10BAC6_18770 [soil metagenome]
MSTMCLKFVGRYRLTLLARPYLVVQAEDYDEIQDAAEEFFGRVT